MIKAVAIGDDGKTIITLGLSFANLDKLRADALDGFIKITGKDIGVPVDILIFAGESEAVLTEFMKDYIGPDTVLHVSGKLKQ